MIAVWWDERGVSLLETAVALLIVAIITVPLVGIASQFLLIPVDWQANITSNRDARHAVRLMSEDVRRSLVYSPAEEPDYGTFAWTDYTLPSPRHYAVRYFYDASTSSITRAETVDGQTTVNPLSIVAGPTVTTLSVTSTADSLRGTFARNHTIQVAARVVAP
jgi:hypothetical protein